MNPAIAQSLPIISLVVVGFMLKKTKILFSGDGSVLVRVILNVTLPAVIFLSIARAEIEPLRLLLLSLIGVLAALAVRYTAALAIKPLKLERCQAGVVLIGAMVMNVGAFLFPLVESIYGAEGVSRLAAFDLGNSLVAGSYGYYLASTFSDQPPIGIKASLRRALSLPILWSCLLGTIINLSGVSLPAFMLKLLQPVASANTPLAMIALGTFLDFKFPRLRLMSLTVFLRMGVGFLIGQALIALFGLQGLERAAVGLGSAMPVGMVTLVYAVTNHLDAEFAAAVISLSIVAGVVLVPLMLLLY